MGISRRLRDLERQIDGLRKHFLPKTFDPLGVYPNPTRTQARMRAFLVLSHAEIESYLEGWAKEIARASEVAWTTYGRISKPLTFLFATLSERIEVPATLAGPRVRDCPQRLVDASVTLFQTYYKQIKDNNGIKEKNVLALFGPLGIPAAALGGTLLPNLDTLGGLRGKHAHNSAKAVQSPLDPETEYKKVKALVKDLQVVDAWLVKYRSQIR